MTYEELLELARRQALDLTERLTKRYGFSESRERNCWVIAASFSGACMKLTATSC